MTQEKSIPWRHTARGKKKIKEWWNKHKEQINKGQRERYHRDLRKQWNRWLIAKYGITVEVYDEMVVKQNNLCAICSKPDTTRLSVDHSHETGKIRGLLCRKCNKFLYIVEEPNWIINATRYLEDYS